MTESPRFQGRVSINLLRAVDRLIPLEQSSRTVGTVANGFSEREKNEKRHGPLKEGVGERVNSNRNFSR